MKTTAILAVLLGSWMTVGCANFVAPSTNHSIESGKSYWLSYDASRRGTVIFADEGKPPRICAEPAPDVALSFVNTVKGSLQTPGGMAAQNVDAAFNATALALGGRDDVVLLAREALFRICEAQLNGVLKEGDVRALFQDVFQQVKEIATEQAKSAKSKADIAQTELQLFRAKSQDK